LYIARPQIGVTGKSVEVQTARCDAFPDADEEEALRMLALAQ
jgi:hypothetical protein